VNWHDWRTIGVVALLPVAIAVGLASPSDYLPEHTAAPLYLAALVILGLIFGTRAVALVVVACIATFFHGKANCEARHADDCALYFLYLTFVPLLASAPVLVASAVAHLARMARRS
jgi:hypothetical protein